jgi:hypothetical protein
MFIPQWTLPNILFYLFCAGTAISMGVFEYSNLLVLRYSKFKPEKGIHPRIGMFIGNFFPLLAAIIFSIPYLQNPLPTQAILLGMIVFHFTKRTLETLLLHKYSGPIELFSALFISAFYSWIAGTISYLNSRQTTAWDSLVMLGIIIFIIGELGNFSHHLILARLRRNRNGYVIPQGGLFKYVACPNYLFEIISWVGIFAASRQLFTLLALIGMTGYLVARSLKTLRWYQVKFADYPKTRKALIPFTL